MQLYTTIGITKQAVSQYQKRSEKLSTYLSELIVQADIIRAQHPGCGLEKMYFSLQPDLIGRDRFVEIFKHLGYGLIKKKNYIKTTKPVHCKYRNLIEGMLLNNINQVIQSDITYYEVAGLFYYIVFIIDVYSKRIVGFQANDHMRAQANVMALKQVLKIRRQMKLNQMVHHSDRGSQYIANDYRKLLGKYHINISMGQNAMENAYAERINGIIKNEYLEYWNITDLSKLRKCLTKAVKHYNNDRPHNHLSGKMSPIKFENALQHKHLKVDHYELIYAEQNSVKRSQLNRKIEQNGVKIPGICPIFYNFN